MDIKREYLVVKVIRADVPSGCRTSCSYLVELHFNGTTARFSTSIKHNVYSPSWNESFTFDTRDRDMALLPSDNGNNAASSPGDVDRGDQTLEAYVYEVDQIRDSSRLLLGKLQLGMASFFQDPYSAADKTYKWQTDQSSTGPETSRTEGALVLKIFLASSEEIRRESWARNRSSYLWSYLSCKDGDEDLSRPAAGSAPREIHPHFESGRVIEQMQYLFVRIVKAHGLPDVDANGSLDPYVEVKFDHYRGETKVLKRNKNPEWNTVFAFPMLQHSVCSPNVHVIVKDKDLVRDDLVGMVIFNPVHVQTRSPHDIPLEPMWYKLVDLDGGRKKSAQRRLMLAIWISSQADPAYRDAWTPDTVRNRTIVTSQQVSHISQLVSGSGARSKVYENPSLWYLRLKVLEAAGLTVAVVDGDDELRSTCVFITACVGRVKRRTRPCTLQARLTRYHWNEEFMFVVAEPFDVGQVEITASCTRERAGPETVIGKLIIPLASLKKRAGDRHVVPRWFPLQPQPQPEGDALVVTDDYNCMRIRLRSSLDGGYHVMHDSCYRDDMRPADKQLWSPPIGCLELGILGATGLTLVEGPDGKSTLHPYCVAKCGGKWVRTRTIVGACDPVFNEQHNWDVYDTETVLTVGVFHDCLQGKSINKDVKIGMVRVRLSQLETGRIYAYAYPLFILTPGGARGMGELRLAVRFSSTSSSLNLIRMYTCPIAPMMHYTNPIPFATSVVLQPQALDIMFHGLSRMEPPLKREVLEQMCSSVPNLWSFRISNAHLFRLKSSISGLISAAKCFQDLCTWSNPATTLLAHAIFLLVVWFHQLILPLLLLCIVFMGVRNYWRRPRHPQHIDLRLSHADLVQPDELDEEFDTFPTSQSKNVLIKRYDRLRSLAGRVQTAVGDIATHCEKVQALLSWRDPRATAIFLPFTLMAAIILYYIPTKLLLALAGFYIMRHPILRTKTPPLIINFINRSPSEIDCLM